MVIATSTAILIAGGLTAGAAVYGHQEQKKAQKRSEKNLLDARLQADQEAEQNRLGLLENKRKRLASYKRNDTTFTGTFEPAKTQRKTLTGE